MQIVATVLVWEHCWYFMPSAADEDPILRVSWPEPAAHYDQSSSSHLLISLSDALLAMPPNASTL